MTVRKRVDRRVPRRVRLPFRWTDDAPLVAFAVLVSLVLAAYLTAQLWGPEWLPGDDVAGHIERTETGLRLLAQFRLDGWNPRWAAGYENFLIYGPGMTLAAAVVKLLSFGLLSTPGALKVLVVATFALTPLTAAFTARCLGFTTREASIVAVLGFAVSNPYGVGVAGTFGLGLLTHQVAEIPFFIALGALARSLTDDRLRWRVLLVVSVWATVVTHAFAVIALALFGGALVVAVALDRALVVRRVAATAVAGVIAAALAAFWLLPFLVNSDLRGGLTSWTNPPFADRMAEIADGRLLFTPVAATLVVIGLAWGFVRVGRRRPFALFVAAAPIAVLALCHWLAHQYPGALTLQLPNRMLGYAGIMAIMPLASLLASIELPRLRFPSFVAAVLAAFVLVLAPSKPWTDLIGSRIPKPTDDLAAAAREVRRLVPPDGHFIVARDYPGEIARTGVIQPDRWIVARSRRNALNHFPLELAVVNAAAELAANVWKRPDAGTVAGLDRYGVTHVVATSAEQVAGLEATGVLTPVWRRGTMTILGRSAPLAPAGAGGAGRSPLVATDVASRTVRAGDETMEVRVSPDRAMRVPFVVSWSPRWYATVDGQGASIHREPDGLLSVDVPAGTHVVRLRHRLDAAYWLGVLVSLATALGLARLGWLRRRRYRMSSSFSRTA